MKSSCVALAVGAVLSWIAQGSVHAATPQSWSQFQGDAAHSGYVSGTINPAQFQLIWSLSAASLGYTSFVPNVAIDSGQVYVSGLNQNGSNPYTGLVTFNAATGSTAWSQTLPIAWFGSLSAPSVGNGLVYVDRFGDTNVIGQIPPTIYAFHTGNGAQAFATNYDGQSDVGGQPAISGGNLYLSGGTYGGFNTYNAISGALTASNYLPFQEGWTAAADSTHAYVYLPAAGNPNIGALYVFGPSGTTTIQNPPNNYTSLNQVSNVTLGAQNDALIVTSTNGGPWQLTSFDLQGQSVKWRANLSYTYPFGNFLAYDSGKIAINNGVIYVDNGNKLSLFSETDGSHITDWISPDGQLVVGNPIVTDNVLFAQTSDATYALDLVTLNTLWSVPSTGELALSNGELLIDNGSTISAYSAPEPASGSLLLLTAACLLRRRRRRGIYGRE